MDMSDTKNKPLTGSVKRKKLEKDADGLTKKEFFLAYNAFAAFLNLYEQTFPQPKRRQVRYAKAFRLAERRVEEKHLDRAIISAESYTERDLLFRRIAAQNYKVSKWFMKKGDYKQAKAWMTLALRFLKLSLDPKAKQMDEKFEAELDELKAAMKKREEEEGEEEEEDEES